MIRSQKIRGQEDPGADGPPNHGTAAAIFCMCVRLQLSWASCMHRLASHVPRPAKLAAFVISAGICCSVSIYNILAGPDERARSRFLPRSAEGSLLPPREHDRPRATVQQADLGRVAAYVRYMDSLARAPDGRSIYDSIMLARPGLLDSARKAIPLSTTIYK